MQNHVFACGHAEFRFLDGELVELRSGTLLAGYLFKGKGEFSYLSEEPIEKVSFPRSIKELTSLKMEGFGLKDTFGKAVIWTSAAGIPGLPASLPAETSSTWKPLMDEVSQGFRPVNADATRRYSDLPSWLPIATTMAASRINHPEALVVHALLTGGKENWDYQFDPALDRTENLSLFYERYPFLLSKQPIGWTFKQPLPPACQLSHLEVKVDHKGGPRVELEIEETLLASLPNQRCVMLNFRDRRAMQDSRNMDPNSGWIEGLKIQDAQGRPIPFLHANGNLYLEFPEALPVAQPVRFKATYGGELIALEEKREYWQLGVWAWFPQPDLDGQYYTVHATLTCPPPFVPIMPGTWVRKDKDGEKNRLEIRIDKPIQFFVMNAGKFDVLEDKRPERTIRVVTYTTETRNAKTLANLSHQIIGFYEKMLGPFPFAELNIIQQLAYGFGQAPPGTVYITREALANRADGLVNRFYIKGINDRIAHELAHQYFGHLVKFGSEEDQWISEGFSEYCSGLAMLVSEGKGEAHFKQMIEGWNREGKEAAAMASIPTCNRVWSKDYKVARPLRRRLLYDKSAYLVYDLNQKLGEQGFATLIWNFLDKNQWKFVGASQLAVLAGIISGKDFEPYFDRYLWGAEMPTGKSELP